MLYVCNVANDQQPNITFSEEFLQAQDASYDTDPIIPLDLFGEEPADRPYPSSSAPVGYPGQPVANSIAYDNVPLVPMDMFEGMEFRHPRRPTANAAAPDNSDDCLIPIDMFDGMK